MEIKLMNGFNIRDLGGYKTKDGLTIQSHRLVRGGYLSELNKEDQLKLYNYGIRTIIDLRTPDEIQKYPDKYVSSTEYIKLPILTTDMGELQVQKLVYKNEVPDSSAGYWYMFHLYYQLITNSEAQNAYHRFLTTLARALSYGSVLFHCSTGKDRTGVVTSILLYLLGVDLSVIKDDYLITNQLSVERINRRINEAKEFDVNPAYLKSIFDISIVRPIYFKFMEKLIEDLYGSFDLYLRKQLNVPNSLINQLKNLLIKE